MTRIALEIESMILDGVPLAPAEGELVRRSVERELTRLLSEDPSAGEALRLGHLPVMPELALPRNARAEAIGHALAGTLHEGLLGARPTSPPGQNGARR